MLRERVVTSTALVGDLRYEQKVNGPFSMGVCSVVAVAASMPELSASCIPTIGDIYYFLIKSVENSNGFIAPAMIEFLSRGKSYSTGRIKLPRGSASDIIELCATSPQGAFSLYCSKRIKKGIYDDNDGVTGILIKQLWSGKAHMFAVIPDNQAFVWPLPGRHACIDFREIGNHPRLPGLYIDTSEAIAHNVFKPQKRRGSPDRVFLSFVLSRGSKRQSFD